MIIKNTNEYNSELTDFLFKYNNLKEYFIAWVPENYEEILSLDKGNFFICLENDKIVGTIGTYISKEQKVARLLGPIVIKDYFDKYVDELYEECIQALPKDMKELRVAFFEENILCKSWYEKKEFSLYNAEKTMVYGKEEFIEEEAASTVIVKPYEEKYKEGLSLVHPLGTFFTLKELVDRINSHCHLLLAVVGEEVVGYTYYELSKDNKQGEIALLHVRSDNRGKGYGTMLLNRAISNLNSLNVQEILTSVRVTNYEAQKLYERIGFIDRETIYGYKKEFAK